MVQCRRCQHPIQGTRKPQRSQQPSSADDIDVVVWRRVSRCRRRAAADARRRVHRPIATNKQRRRPPCCGPPAASQNAAQAADAGRAACRSISRAHRCLRAPLGQSEQGHRRSPQQSCLILLPSRTTPYLAPAAGASSPSSPPRPSRARVSAERIGEREAFSADGSVPPLPTPHSGHQKTPA